MVSVRQLKHLVRVKKKPNCRWVINCMEVGGTTPTHHHVVQGSKCDYKNLELDLEGYENAM